MPTRHIHIRNEDRTPDLSWISITLDLGDITFHRRQSALRRGWRACRVSGARKIT
ncbi:hypothetical protein [Streptomyces lunaelactis]|uniref:hypothetical protein n=1 Tax=Streptomyces lunaelactis TaxID=1535768 RepID=UPI00131F1441|nr:hypothetical protein [Streptomyces lunaelactis]NUK89838.1 hypothetical protein [Streptomyces lunaelactis]